MRWPFVTRRRLDALQLQLEVSRGNESVLFKLNCDMFHELCDAQIRAVSLAPNARALVTAATKTIDAAVGVEWKSWTPQHADLEAALGELIVALEPFAVTVRRAKAQRRPA